MAISWSEVAPRRKGRSAFGNHFCAGTPNFSSTCPMEKLAAF
jgi:hypothetical protein